MFNSEEITKRKKPYLKIILWLISITFGLLGCFLIGLVFLLDLLLDWHFGLIKQKLFVVGYFFIICLS